MKESTFLYDSVPFGITKMAAFYINQLHTPYTITTVYWSKFVNIICKDFGVTTTTTTNTTTATTTTTTTTNNNNCNI
jgi:hypothetical protein